MNFKFLLLTTFFLAFTAYLSKAQLYEISLDQKISNSEIIIEGEVIKKIPYLTEDGFINTRNEIAVYKSFKGQAVPEKLFIITKGGTLNGLSESWSHLLELAVGQAGIFCLKDKMNTTNDLNNEYEIYSSLQGFLRYEIEKEKVLSATAPFAQYKDIQSELYDVFRSRSGIPIYYKAPSWEKSAKCISYHFDVTQPTNLGANYTFNALVSVKSTEGNFLLYKSSIVADYDLAILGQNIVQNEKLGTSPIGISNNSSYDITAVDLSSNRVEIQVSANTSSLNSLYSVGESFTPLVNLSITVSAIGDPSIVLNQVRMRQNSSYINESSSLEQEFACIEIEGDFETSLTCDPPVISAFSPTNVRAGTCDTLTIEGMCFDTIRGSSEVEFLDADTGPTPVKWVAPLKADYIVWTDTLIRVLVPSFTSGGLKNPAGTGNFRVRKGNGQIAMSPSEIFVPFAALNNAAIDFTIAPPASQNTASKIYLGNLNDMGGQSIYYTSEFRADTNAIMAFERALENWRCKTFINYVVQDSIDVPDINQAGKIEFDELPVGTMTTTLASNSNIPYILCQTDSITVGSRRPRFFIKFNSLLNWHTAETMPNPLPVNTFDLESRAVHELGHAHLLAHSLNPNDLMYFTDLTPPYRRNIQANDEEGGDYIVSISSNPPDTCDAPMIPLTLSNCMITSIVELSDEKLIDIEIYPNPATNEVFLNVSSEDQFSTLELNAELYDLIGHKISTKSISTNQVMFDISSLSAGVYFVTISQKGQFVKTFKLIKE